MASYLVETLLKSWKDYKNNMKHKRKQMSLEDVIIHIRIEEQNRNRDNVEKAKELSSKANVVEEKPKPKTIGPGNKTLGPSPMHQTRSRTQLLKNGVIVLSVASLDTMQLNVATGKELRNPI